MKKTLAIIGVLLLILNMVTVPVAAAEQTELERVIQLIDSLPDTYEVGNGDLIAEISAIIDENGFTKKDIGSAKYLKFYSKHVKSHSSWLSQEIQQDRVKIDWLDKNHLAAVDMFEIASYDSKGKYIEIPVEDFAMKPGIVMESTNDKTFPSTYAYGRFIGFYETGSVKKKYSETFPDSYGEYYITENSVQYGYSGISKKVGDITYNAGIVSPNTSFEINFDKYTPYAEIGISMAGITFLSEYSRHVQVAKTTVYFADGSSKEQFHIVGPYCYGYRMALYSTLADKEVMYSEYLGQNALAKSLARTWMPTDANADQYFKIGDGIVLTYASDKVTKTNKLDTTVGFTTSVEIDADNKPVDRVKVEYASVEEIKELGGLKYAQYTSKEETPKVKDSKDCYYIPIDKNQLKDVSGYEEERDYYIGVIHSGSYPIYLHGVTGIKSHVTSYKDEITDIEEAINDMPENFEEGIYSQLETIKNRYDFLLRQGVSKFDFSPEAIEKFEKLLAYNQQSGKYVVYVAPNGDDKASGSKDAPLKTLNGAKLLVRSLKKDKPIDVVFREGEYNIDETVYFTANDSGTEEFPITYKSDGGAVFTAADKLNFSDFTLVEDGEDDRIPTDLIGKIYKVDLNKKGIDAGEMPILKSTNIDGDGYDDVAFFVNDKEQMVSQWPNGESNYATWEKIHTADINGVVIQVDPLRSKAWQGEKYSYFEGYPSVDYSNERNNLTIDGDLIRFRNVARFDADEKHSRRYKVKHLLAELDMPGEWYIDRDTNVLYYYPIEDFDKNAEIEIATRKILMVDAKQLRNVNFDGLTFDKIRGYAIKFSANTENANVYNCTFKNITNIAVRYYSSQYYGSELSGVASYIDAAKDCEVRNNKFVNIGSAAISFNGGNRIKLADGNNVIANNYLYDISNKQRCTPAITISGAYNYALNNEAHFITFHALNYGGNENVVAYNEFYDALRDTGDCGVIYNGRNLSTRGNEIAYNYLHDYKQLDSRTSDNCVGIYLDDRLSGIYIHHNIIFPNGVGADGNGIQNGGGQHNKINYNIIVDADEVMTRTNRFIEDYKNISDCSAFNEIIGISGMDDTNQVRLDDGYMRTYTMFGRNELYFEKYPEMNDSIETLLNPNETVPKFVEKYPFILTLPEFSEGGKYGNLAQDLEEGNDLSRYRLLSLKSTIGNEYIENISNTYWRAMTNKDSSGNVYDVYREFGSVFEGNEEGADESIFVDYENKDFRLKGSTNGGALDESFDLDTIGLQEDGNVSYDLDFEINDYDLKEAKTFTSEEKQFNLTYPENNGRVKNVKDITFMWERPVSSDYFTIEVATDPQMQNIVYKNENAYFNFETVTTLPEDVRTFYWRVKAKNISRNEAEWQNTDGVNVFHAYDTAIVEMPASVPFDIEADFNVDIFNNAGETHNNKNNLGGKDETLGMYNLTNLKKLVPADGYFNYLNTLYKFPQVGYDTNSKNAVSTKQYSDDNTGWLDSLKGKTTNYTYTLKANEQGKYDKIKVAMSSARRAVDYKITVNYTDNTSTDGLVEIHQYYTTYYSTPGSDIILTTDGVNYLGGQVSRSNLNKIYEAEIDADESKTVKSITFNYKSGTITGDTTNNEFIFAITGVKNEITLDNGDVEKPIVLNNYSGEAKNVLFLVTGIENGVFKSVFLTGEIANSVHYPSVTVNIPAKVYNWINKKVFIWENNKFAPLGAKTTFFK